LRQRLRAAYMRALYQGGRQAEALETYADLRRHLADQFGLDPDPQLVRLQQAILRRDQRLAVPAAPGLASRSAPRSARRSNLPTPLTSLIGREEAIEQVRSRLAAGRLVTLTGPGGVGKTRLAVEVARQIQDQYHDGAWLVELAAIEQRPGGGPELEEPAVRAGLVRLIATALRLDDRVLGPAGDPLPDADAQVERLAGMLRDRRSLLVLDNCEHVLAPVNRLSELLLRAA